MRKKKLMDLENDFQVFRKGMGSFVGFNADAVTGWSTHAARSAAIGPEIAKISQSLEAVRKEPASPFRDNKICKLEAELNIKRKNMSQELGYPKAITNSDATDLKIALPDKQAQEQIMATFASKQYRCE